MTEVPREKSSHRKQQDRRAKGKIQPAPRRKSNPPKGFLPLIEEECLYFSLALGPREAWDSQDFDPRELAQDFKNAFTSVWESVPLADRQRLLAYWRDLESCSPLPRAPVDQPRPLIQIVGASHARVSQAISRLGHDLAFPAQLVQGDFKLLHWEIARVLAQVFRYVSREHWGLILELLEEPLARWEQEQGSRASHAAREKKLDTLETEYLRQLEGRVNQILQSWGISKKCR